MKLIHMKHFPNVGGFVGFTLYLSFLIVVFDNKGQLFRIDKDNSTFIMCYTYYYMSSCKVYRIYKNNIIIFPLFNYLTLYPYFCISCHFRHSKKLNESKIY